MRVEPVYTPVSRSQAEAADDAATDDEALLASENADPGSGTDGGEADDEVGPSGCFLVSINTFAFAYSLVVATLGVVILPSEALRLFHDRHAMMLGVMLGCTGITQLIGPAVGYNSDRSTSSYGRRRPLMVVGCVIACAGSLCMLFARQYRLCYLYIGALTTAVTGLNISYACYTALLPDLIPAAHLGRASGTMATMSMLGALLGFGLFGFILRPGQAYAIYVAVTAAAVLVTCIAAREKPRREVAPFRMAELIQSYSIDAVAHPDFFWVFVTRVFYYMGISLQAFVLFMLRDVQRVQDPTYYTSLLAMIGQLSAALVAAPSGLLSDRYGRKPLVYAACLIMAIVFLGFAAGPRIEIVLWLGVGYGLGNGMFLSVDYALACDTLPSLESAAQGLGVWGVSAFLGSTLGPLIAAPLLSYFGWTPSPERYAQSGYAAVNLAGAVYVCCSGLFLCFVRTR